MIGETVEEQFALDLALEMTALELLRTWHRRRPRRRRHRQPRALRAHPRQRGGAHRLARDPAGRHRPHRPRELPGRAAGLRPRRRAGRRHRLDRADRHGPASLAGGRRPRGRRRRPARVARAGDGPTIAWDLDARTIDPDALAGVDAVVHLAGEPIGAKRLSDDQKRQILESRVVGTTVLAEALAELAGRGAGRGRSSRPRASATTATAATRCSPRTSGPWAELYWPSLPMVRWGQPMPAQLTSTRTGPSSLAASTAAMTCSSSVTSVGANTPPVAASTSLAFSSWWGRSTMTTFAPRSASLMAVASPRPDAPPVTIADAPAMSMEATLVLDLTSWSSSVWHAAGMADPALHRFPRVALAHLPTPLEPCRRLHAERGGPLVWLNRDDCTGLALGGNKTRKLEFLLGRARADRAPAVVTTGALQSNHARQTAAACAHLGLPCHLVAAPQRAARRRALPHVGQRPARRPARRHGHPGRHARGGGAALEADDRRAHRRHGHPAGRVRPRRRARLRRPPASSWPSSSAQPASTRRRSSPRPARAAPCRPRHRPGRCGRAAGGGRSRCPTTSPPSARSPPTSSPAPPSCSARNRLRCRPVVDGFIGPAYGIPTPAPAPTPSRCWPAPRASLLDPVYTAKAFAHVLRPAGHRARRRPRRRVRPTRAAPAALRVRPGTLLTPGSGRHRGELTVHGPAAAAAAGRRRSRTSALEGRCWRRRRSWRCSRRPPLPEVPSPTRAGRREHPPRPALPPGAAPQRATR